MVTRSGVMRLRNMKKLSLAMHEVHKNIPSTVTRTKVKGKKKKKMLQAIAFSKAGLSKKK